jgi:hypothetical protein
MPWQQANGGRGTGDGNAKWQRVWRIAINNGNIDDNNYFFAVNGSYSITASFLVSMRKDFRTANNWGSLFFDIMASNVRGISDKVRFTSDGTYIYFELYQTYGGAAVWANLGTLLDENTTAAPSIAWTVTGITGNGTSGNYQTGTLLMKDPRGNSTQLIQGDGNLRNLNAAPSWTGSGQEGNIPVMGADSGTIRLPAISYTASYEDSGTMYGLFDANEDDSPAYIRKVPYATARRKLLSALPAGRFDLMTGGTSTETATQTTPQNLNDDFYRYNTGMWWVSANANAPYNGWGGLINIRHRFGVNDGNVWGEQIWIGSANAGYANRMWKRSQQGSATSWAGWYELAMKTDIPAIPSGLLKGSISGGIITVTGTT